jgi:ActR/RegA family two-component response regulator
MAKVLLIEDNEMYRNILSRRLIRRGFHAVFAMDGQQGIELAQIREINFLRHSAPSCNHAA